MKIELVSVNKAFRLRSDSEVLVCQDISVAVNAREFVSIIGPSGCGKSTIFNVVAGLIEPDSGQVLIDGQSVAGQPGHVGYMLQKDLLLPWRTIVDNVVLGAELLGESRHGARKDALALMHQFGLKGFEDAWPSRLSGGMRQRAAFMRTLLSRRDILLLDEPFGALDAMTRLAMQEWLLSVWTGLERTVLFITHDVDEAVFLSDRIYVMTARPGRIKAVVDVPLPRPRDYDITTDASFAEIKHRLLELIHAELVDAPTASLGEELDGHAP